MINQLTRSYARYSRHRGTLYQSQFVKKRFASLFPGPPDFNDKHKAIILGENAKRFYNL